MGLIQHALSGLLPPQEARAKKLSDFLADAGSESAAGIRVGPDTVIRGDVYKSVNHLARVFASLPTFLYRRTDDDGRERATAHYLYDIVHRRPNRWMTSYEFYHLLVHNLALRFNFYAQKLFDGRGLLTDLVPLMVDGVQVSQLDDLRVVYRYDPPGGGPQRTLFQDEVLHVHGWSADGVTGVDGLDIMREALGFNAAAEMFGASVLGNGVNPLMTLNHPGTLSADAATRLRRKIEERHGGPRKAGRVMVLEEGMEAKGIGITPKELQLLEAREFSRTDIAGLYGVAPHKIGALERSTFSNIEHQAIEQVVDTYRPLAVCIEQRMELSLLTDADRASGHYIEFMLDGLLRGDSKAEAEALLAYRQAGAITANWIAKRKNFPPVPEDQGGDTYYVPANWLPAGMGPMAQEPPDDSGPSDPEDDDSDPPQEPEPEDDSGDRAARVADNGQSLDPPGPEPASARRAAAQPAGQAEARLRQRAAHGRLFAELAGRAVAREGREVRAAMQRLSFGEFQDWLRRFAEDELRPFLEQNARPIVAQYAENLRESLAGERALTHDLEQFVGELAGGLARRYVRASVGQLEALAREQPTDEARAEAIAARLAQWADTRAAKVGQRETVQLGEALARFILEEQGARSLTWLRTGRCTPFCAALEGRIVAPRQPFADSGELLRGAEGEELRPRRKVLHPPLVPDGCACVVV